MTLLLTIINSGYVLISTLLLIYSISKKQQTQSKELLEINNFIFSLSSIVIITFPFFSIQDKYLIYTLSSLAPSLLVFYFLPYLIGQLFWIRKLRKKIILTSVIVFILIFYHYIDISKFHTTLPYPGEQHIVFISIPNYQLNLLYALIYLTAFILIYIILNIIKRRLQLLKVPDTKS